MDKELSNINEELLYSDISFLGFMSNKKNKMEGEWLKIIRLSPVAWQHINLIGKYEFYNDKECLNLHEVIQNLIANEKIDLLATA
ncbi:hypothetical protein Ldro_3039 [Legionella drozanskii LLAP-1]|uniref:Transposase n=2 Tax=Legionella drozanskii TaxID=96228 RepID=A0A0W0SMD2_9GAMM|nr:hypothetical protein [Legionella drozanskii]KTC84436.1 hypothetical protein Ldro_3039 [Legionella drozanskii LLAP-1]